MELALPADAGLAVATGLGDGSVVVVGSDVRHVARAIHVGTSSTCGAGTAQVVWDSPSRVLIPCLAGSCHGTTLSTHVTTSIQPGALDPTCPEAPVGAAVGHVEAEAGGGVGILQQHSGIIHQHLRAGGGEVGVGV